MMGIKRIVFVVLLFCLLVLTGFVWFQEAPDELGLISNLKGSLVLSKLDSSVEQKSVVRAQDTSSLRVNGEFKPGSHVKLFLPYLPYIAITHSINGTLTRPAKNVKGWEYYLAESHVHKDNRIFEFKLKKGVTFQDGSTFDADAVLLNMKYFKEKPFTFTKLWRVFDRAEKIDDYTVRFILTEANGVFLHDLTYLPFFTKSYLDKFGWNGKSVCANLAEPGPYALGPYILTEGYVEGDRSTAKVVLKANPNYWGKAFAKVETITIYTTLNIEGATDLALYKEGEIDITPIPFSSEIETVLSKFSKLVVTPSTNQYAVHFNLINGRNSIKDDRIRYVINQSIDKEMLLNLSMLGEGTLSPAMISPNYYKVDKAFANLKGFFEFEKFKLQTDSKLEVLKSIVASYQRENGLDSAKALEIKMLVQESFVFLARDIQFFLSRVNIDLKLDVVTDEKSVFKQLFRTHKSENDKDWDILIWANFDWFRHPWAAFFVYSTENAWSTIPKNAQLIEMCDQLLKIDEDSEEYTPLISSFIKYVYRNNYMLFLPSPHMVYAVNKEVVFHPRTSPIVPLWELEVTDMHWSLRGDEEYPEKYKVAYEVQRENFQEGL